MGLWNFIRNQFIDIIEWLDDTNYTLVWRFPDQDHEIKMNAKLIVREGQAAVFINEGTLADIFQAGTYSLATQNLPILSDLKGWKYGFESPFKAEVYFVNLRQYLDQKWGTTNPILLRDPEFGPVRVRAFGIYAFRVVDPAVFMREVVGTDGQFTVEEIEGQLKRTLVASFTSALAGLSLPVLEMAGHYDRVVAQVVEKIQPSFQTLGLKLTRLIIENISFPPEVEKLLDQRTGISILGNQMDAFTKMSAAQALRDMANNPARSDAASGLGLVTGLTMGNLVTQQINAPSHDVPRQPASTGGSTCRSCGYTNAGASRFCPNCGAQQGLACPSCQTPLSTGTKFCNNCGTRIGG